MPELKNPTFIKNITDPENSRQVKKIWECGVTKLNRPIERLVWEYYSDRATNSVEDLYKKYKDKNLKIIYFNDPKMYYREKNLVVTTLNKETKDLPFNKDNKE